MTWQRKGWTFGAEHELADWPRDRGLLPGWGLDERDVTMVNSNGVAVDPKGVSYRFGGEFNSPPTDTPSGQAELLADLKLAYPEARVNYRSNLHIHVRVPGLSTNLAALKRLQRFNARFLAEVLEVIEPIPKPVVTDFATGEEYEGAVRRYRRRCRSHHTVLPERTVQRQLKARTVDEFLEAEVPRGALRPGETKRPLWHLQPRAAVNLRQLRETDTIEFRHFPGTLEPLSVMTATRWCQTWLFYALQEGEGAADPSVIAQLYAAGGELPKFEPYVHWQELRYRATCHDGTLKRDEIERNIARILAGEFER